MPKKAEGVDLMRPNFRVLSEARENWNKKLFFLLPLLTVVLRTVWLVVFPNNPVEPVDARGFQQLAHNLAAGNGFSMDPAAPFCPALVRTPLYPFYLTGIYALLGEDPARAVLFSLLLEALTTALVVRLGRTLSGRPGGALAGLLYAFNFTTPHYAGALWSETLLLPLMAAALWATLTGWRRPGRRTAALAGLSWGLVVLTKPNFQYLALAMAGLWWLASRRQRWTTAFFGLGIMAAVGPWLIYNDQISGRWMLSTAFEENLSRVSAVATLAAVRETPAEPWTPTWEVFYMEIVGQAADRYGWTVWDDAQLSCREREEHHRQIAVVAGEVTRAHPLEMLGAHLWGVGHSLWDPGHARLYLLLTGRSWESTGVVEDIWVRMGESLRIWAVGDALYVFWMERVVRIPWDAALLWWGLGIGRLGLWYAGLRGAGRLRRRWPAALALIGVIGYCIGLAGPIAYDRFYLPAIPAVITLVVVGIFSGSRQ